MLKSTGRDALWQLPDGSVEAAEDGASALQREIAEELGMTLSSCPLGVVRAERGPAGAQRSVLPSPVRRRFDLKPSGEHDAHASVLLEALPRYDVDTALPKKDFVAMMAALVGLALDGPCGRLVAALSGGRM